jgi:hypothetical protein
MADEPREGQEAPEEKNPQYEAPEAEELAPDTTADTAPGAPPQSPGDSSDRNLKTGFAEVDVEAVLAGVRQLPITTWSYREDDPRVRHIGPMAQDFAAAFGVGDDDRRIHTVDASGVALAAIQALAARLEAAEARIAELSRSEAYEPPRAEELTDPVAASPDAQPISPGDEFTSDRAAKTGFADVDVEAVLADVRGHRVDANGLALASIQALAARLETAEARLAELEGGSL